MRGLNQIVAICETFLPLQIIYICTYISSEVFVVQKNSDSVQMQNVNIAKKLYCLCFFFKWICMLSQ